MGTCCRLKAGDLNPLLVDQGLGTLAKTLRRKCARCGPRDNWHYEGRWIPPRRINADVGEVVPGRPIYHLPVPEGAAVAMGLEEPP